MGTDAIDILEVAYDVTSDDRAWLRRVAEIAHRALDNGRGVIANYYDVMNPRGVEIEAVDVGTRPGFLDFFRGTSKQLSNGYVKNAYLSAQSCMTTSSVPGFDELPFVKSGELATWNVADDLVLRGWDPAGRGITLNVFLPSRTRLPARSLEHLSRVATHLGAAYRLRGRLLANVVSEDARAEAILTPSGAFEHATGDAAKNAARKQLKDALSAMNDARAHLRARPVDAVRRWRSLVGGRWSLVDELTIGSRRYIVACANTPPVGGPETLSQRERQIVMFTAAGHTTKLIAYELGIADSTVRVLLARARMKLGVKTVAELRERVASWPPPED